MNHSSDRQNVVLCSRTQPACPHNQKLPEW